MRQNLQIQQLDKKIKAFKKTESFVFPGGWINTIRLSLGMSMEQMGKKMKMTAQGIREMEKREREGSISLKALDNAAQALGLKLTYGFYNPGDNLEEMLHAKARQSAEKIVLRTHKTMQLEDQANSKRRLKRAIKEKTIELANNKSKFIWD
jgi:predicted DNA-binding mobile mystery protein A